MNTPSKEALEAAEAFWNLNEKFFSKQAFMKSVSAIIDRHFEPLRQRAEQAEARVKELEASRYNALRERTEAIEQGARDARRADKNAVANAELQKQEDESRRLFYAEQDKRQSAEQRNAELEAALRGMIKNAERDGDTRLAVQLALAALARSETATPDHIRDAAQMVQP